VIGLVGVGGFCVCIFSWVRGSDCPMGLVGELPDEAGYICV